MMFQLTRFPFKPNLPWQFNFPRKERKKGEAKWGSRNSRHFRNLNKLYDLSTLQLVRSLIRASVKLGSSIYCLFCVALSNFTQSVFRSQFRAIIVENEDKRKGMYVRGSEKVMNGKEWKKRIFFFEMVSIIHGNWAWDHSLPVQCSIMTDFAALLATFCFSSRGGIEAYRDSFSAIWCRRNRKPFFFLATSFLSLEFLRKPLEAQWMMSNVY